MVVRVHKSRQNQMVACVEHLHVSIMTEPVTWTNADDLIVDDSDVGLWRIVPICAGR
jgi:hypothetical protein